MQSDAGQGKDCSSPSPRKRRRDTSRMTVKEEVDDAGQGEDELEEEAKPVIKKGAKARQPKKIDGPSPGGWTPEKRAVFIEKVLAAGYKALDLDDVAKELELNKRQLINQLTSGRTGNFRDKCIKHIRGEE